MERPGGVSQVSRWRIGSKLKMMYFSSARHALAPRNLSRGGTLGRLTPTRPRPLNVLRNANQRTLYTAPEQSGSAFTSPKPRPGYSLRISTVFTALLVLGIGSTAYGFYEFYTSLNIWPEEVRSDLRAGLKARYQENFELGEQYLRRAWKTALSLPSETFGAEPYLKISGIAIALASLLEQARNHPEAYNVYAEALSHLQAVPSSELSLEERMRIVAVASKLGEMAEGGLPEPKESIKAEEQWKVLAVEEVLRITQATKGNSSSAGAQNEEIDKEIELPAWTRELKGRNSDVAAPVQILGAFYARVGRIDYAIPLYLKAISVILPPAASASTSAEDRCRGAELMTTLSELMLRANVALPQAEAWAKKAVDVLASTHTFRSKPVECLTCEVVALFNYGSFREMSGNAAEAKALYEQSMAQAQKIGMKEGAREARVALRRLERAQAAAGAIKS